jgi:SAM-dependent methyltransferase
MKSPGPLVQMDGEQLPFRDESFQLVGAFDLIEHLREPQTLLREAYRVLQPGGYLIVTVPAYAHLWSYFDKLSHHRQRYEKDQLGDEVIRAGFELRQLEYWFASLYPVVWLGRRLNLSGHTRHGQTFELWVIPLVNEAAKLVLELERIVSRWMHWPFGTSLMAVGWKAKGR